MPPPKSSDLVNKNTIMVTGSAQNLSKNSNRSNASDVQKPLSGSGRHHNGSARKANSKSGTTGTDPVIKYDWKTSQQKEQERIQASKITDENFSDVNMKEQLHHNHNHEKSHLEHNHHSSHQHHHHHHSHNHSGIDEGHSAGNKSSIDIDVKNFDHHAPTAVTSDVTLEVQMIEALQQKINALEGRNRILERNIEVKRQSEAPANLAWAPAHTEKLVVSLYENEKRVVELEAERDKVIADSQTAQTVAQAECDAFQEEIKDLQSRVKDLSESKVLLEDLSQSSAERISDLERQITMLKDERDVERMKAQMSSSERDNYLSRCNELDSEYEELRQTKASSERDIREELGVKDGKISELEAEVKRITALLSERDNSLRMLDSYKKALLMPVSDSSLAKQVDALRRDYDSALYAIQQKNNEMSILTCKLDRTEQTVSALGNDLDAIRSELQTKNELLGLVQKKNTILSEEAMDRRQLAKQIDELKEAIALENKKNREMEVLNEELSLRLNAHYDGIPMESIDAWLEPIRRANREAETGKKQYQDQIKKLLLDQSQTSIEISHLKAQLGASNDEEKRLQKKVVQQTMLIEQLTEIKERNNDAKSK